jgi:hypothetical protein
MKKYLLLVILSFSGALWAQGIKNVTDAVVNNQFGYLTQIPPKPAGVVGSVYLNEEWHVTTVKLKKETHGVSQLVGVDMKLDLKANTLEFQTDKGIKVIGGHNVEGFSWKNNTDSREEIYLNCDKFSFDGTKLLGFARMLTEGARMSLVQHQYLEIVTAQYNVALDVGSKDHQYTKKDKLYLLKDNALISANKKSIIAATADKKEQVEHYKNEHKLNLKDPSDVVDLIAYYNSL